VARTILEHLKHAKYPRLKIQLRARSRYYQAVTFLDGRKAQQSLKTTDAATALKLGESWYKRILRASDAEAGRHPIARLATAPTMGELFASWRLTLPPAKRPYHETKWGAVGPFWRAIPVTDVTPQLFRQFYKERRRHHTQYGEAPSNATLRKDAILLRQILKHAIEDGHITTLPPIPSPGKTEANPRPWLSRGQFQHLVTVGFERIGKAENARVQQQRWDLADFILAMLESTCRVSELRALTAGAVRIIKPPKPKQPYAVLQVRGKTGHRTVVAGGLFLGVYERRSKGLKPGDLLWKYGQRDAFRELLVAANLRTDEFGNTRNLKSIRATAISLRILSQAPSPDLLMIARNAGTSVAMIDAFYARRLSAEMAAEQLSKSLI
jgi:hypothetical protein